MRALSLLSPVLPLLLLVACPTPKESSAPTDSEAQESTPDKDTDSGNTTDDSADDTSPPNHPPEGLAVAITQLAPQPGEPVSVTILTAATDPDGDPVTYLYAWSRDGVDAGVSTDTVEAGVTALLDTWTVTVTPTDGEDMGAPATATVVIGNQPPVPPELEIDPEDPVADDTIALYFNTEPYDPEGDPITMTILWYDDDALVPGQEGLMEFDGDRVDDQEIIKVVVSVSDGLHEPVSSEIEVLIQYTCWNPPPMNVGDTTLPDARAYHGLAFGDDGSLIGFDGRSLIKSFYDGTRQTWIPGLSGLQQIDRLPDGDYAAIDGSGTLLRIDALTGGTSSIASNLGYAYGVTTGPDGMVYVVASSTIYRVDPVNNTSAVWFDGSNVGATLHVINFNLDSTVAYIGTIGNGTVYYLSLDSNLDPVGSAVVYANRVGSGWHDGLEVDECGNIYVADYSTRGFYRVTPGGTVSSFVDIVMSEYGHGTAWGSGIGGWRDDTIYQPQPYNSNTIREVVVGFHSADTVRTWNGTPAPW